MDKTDEEAFTVSFYEKWCYYAKLIRASPQQKRGVSVRLEWTTEQARLLEVPAKAERNGHSTSVCRCGLVNDDVYAVTTEGEIIKGVCNTKTLLPGDHGRVEHPDAPDSARGETMSEPKVLAVCL